MPVHIHSEMSPFNERKEFFLLPCYLWARIVPSPFEIYIITYVLQTKPNRTTSSGIAQQCSIYTFSTLAKYVQQLSISYTCILYFRFDDIRSFNGLCLSYYSYCQYVVVVVVQLQYRDKCKRSVGIFYLFFSFERRIYIYNALTLIWLEKRKSDHYSLTLLCIKCVVCALALARWCPYYPIHIGPDKLTKYLTSVRHFN